MTKDDDKTSSTNIETNEQPVREHPCKHLIDNFQIPPSCLAKVNDTKRTEDIHESPCDFISTEAKLSELVGHLMQEKEIGIAVKSIPRGHLRRLCLILISCERINYIIDCIALEPHLHMLGDVFTNPDITKITCDAMVMLRNLQLSNNLWFVNIFDMKLAMQKLGMRKSFESYIVHKYNIKTASTSHKPNKWKLRPLPEKYKVNAINSMHYLIPTYYFFRDKLIEAKLLEPLLRDCNQLCGKVYYHDSVELIFKDIQYLTPSKVYAICGLQAWRHTIGKMEKRNADKVLSIVKFKKLIKQMPSKRLQIRKIAESIHVTEHIEEVQKIFLDAKKVIGPMNSRFTAEKNKNKAGQKGEKIAKKAPVIHASKKQKRQRLKDQKNLLFLKNPFSKAGGGHGTSERGGKIAAYSPEIFHTEPRSRTPPSQPRPQYPDRFHSPLRQCRSPPKQFRERSRSPLFHRKSPSKSASSVRRDSSREYYQSNSPPLFQSHPMTFQSPPRQLRERSNSPLFRRGSPPRNASSVRRDSSREYYQSNSPSLFQSHPRSFQPPPRQLRERSNSPLFCRGSPPRSASPIRRDSSRQYDHSGSLPFYNRNIEPDRPKQLVRENLPSSRGVWMNDRNSRSNFQSQESCGSSFTRRNGFTESNFSRNSRYSESSSFINGTRSSRLSFVFGYQNSSSGSREAFVPPISSSRPNQCSGRITYPSYKVSRYCNEDYHNK